MVDGEVIVVGGEVIVVDGVVIEGEEVVAASLVAFQSPPLHVGQQSTFVMVRLPSYILPVTHTV